MSAVTRPAAGNGAARKQVQVQANGEARMPAPAHSLGQILRGILSDPTVPADKLEMLWRMSKEMLAEERREAFDTAFAAMSRVLPQVRRDGLIELTKEGKKVGLIPFARWEDMDELIRPILAEYGFALTFTTIEHATGKLCIRGELMREGHSRFAEIPLPADTGPGRNSLQAVGSTISYGKRYCAEMLLNIVRRGQDDDGNAGGNIPITPAQVKELQALITDTKSDRAKFLEWSGVKSLEEIPAREFVRLKNALNTKKQRNATNGKGGAK
jgi:hypothetical protein